MRFIVIILIAIITTITLSVILSSLSTENKLKNYDTILLNCFDCQKDNYCGELVGECRKSVQYNEFVDYCNHKYNKSSQNEEDLIVWLTECDLENFCISEQFINCSKEMGFNTTYSENILKIRKYHNFQSFS